MHNFLIILTISFVFTSISCYGNDYELVKEADVDNKVQNIRYPYYASKERQERINNGYLLVREGMGVKDVEYLIGTPDEINDVFDKNNWDKKIGFSYVYLLERIVPQGSVNEKKEKLVRVMFDVDNKVIRVDKW